MYLDTRIAVRLVRMVALAQSLDDGVDFDRIYVAGTVEEATRHVVPGARTDNENIIEGPAREVAAQ